MTREEKRSEDSARNRRRRRHQGRQSQDVCSRFPSTSRAEATEASQDNKNELRGEKEIEIEKKKRHLACQRGSVGLGLSAQIVQPLLVLEAIAIARDVQELPKNLAGEEKKIRSAKGNTKKERRWKKKQNKGRRKSRRGVRKREREIQKEESVRAFREA